VLLETTIVPRPPYSLALSARHRSDTTRRFRDGVLTLALEAAGRPALARVRQRADGRLDAAIEGAEPRPLFAFPGIWRRYRGPVKKDGPAVDLDVFSILTTTPNALVGTINHERMPVLLNEERDYETWLKGTTDDAFTLARSFPAGAMRIVAKGSKEDLGTAEASA